MAEQTAMEKLRQWFKGDPSIQHADAVAALDEVEADLVQAQQLNAEWEAAFRADGLPEIVTPGHAVQWARGMLEERDSWRRVAERCESEKQQTEAELTSLRDENQRLKHRCVQNEQIHDTLRERIKLLEAATEPPWPPAA